MIKHNPESLSEKRGRFFFQTANIHFAKSISLPVEKKVQMEREKKRVDMV